MSETTDLVLREEQTAVSVLEGESPAARVAFARATAQALAPVITDGHLFAQIGPKKHVLYEGWTTLGQMLGVFPVTVWTKPLANGYEARVEARTRGGAIVGAAEAECTRDEDNWKDRDDYALRSMAQTRAGSKALRMCLGFIVTLAGFDATPAEEMGGKQSKPAGTTMLPNGEPTPECKCGDGRMLYREGTKSGKAWQGLWCPSKKDPIVWLHVKAEAVPERDIDEDPSR